MAGFLTYSPKHLPTHYRAVAIERPGFNELTATGIVPDSNRIPFYQPPPSVAVAPFSDCKNRNIICTLQQRRSKKTKKMTTLRIEVSSSVVSKANIIQPLQLQ